MRVVWKDSNPRKVRPTHYKNFVVNRINLGWITNIPGDNNIYSTRKCAMSAIDNFLGFEQKEHIIHVIGKRTDAS